MLTAKERHVRFVSWFLVCLRGLVAKAGGALYKTLSGSGSNPAGFISASEDWNTTGFELVTPELKGEKEGRGP